MGKICTRKVLETYILTILPFNLYFKGFANGNHARRIHLQPRHS